MENLERRIAQLEKENIAMKSFESLAKRVMNISTGEVKPTISDINNQLVNATKSMNSVVFIETKVVVQDVEENESRELTEYERFLEMFGFNFFMPYTPPPGTGSGIIYKKDIILTNYHVVDAVAEYNYEVWVYFNNDSKKGRKGKLIAGDSKLDLAVISVDTGDCPVMTIGNSDDLNQGEIVLALGAPIGSRSTVSMGVFGGKKMIPWESDLDQRLNEVIQTDADMMGGNSGGPLVDINGKLLGINTYVRADAQTGGTLGFSIPITKAQPFIEEMLNQGEVIRIMIGVNFSQTTMVVSGVSSDGGSYNKLKDGDMIEEVNGVKIKPMSNDIMQNLKKGDNVLKIIRDGEAMEVTVTGEEYLWDSVKRVWMKNEVVA